MGATIAEKILARASGRETVKAGEYVTARPDYAMCHESAAGAFLKLMEGGADSVWDRNRIVIILDHYVPANTERAATIHKMIRDLVEQFRIPHYYGESAGVCHQVMIEKGFVMPGKLIVGADSHTTTYGAFGCASTGLGFSDMAHVLYTGELWFKVPETIRYNISGELGSYVMGKDIILNIAGRDTVEAAQYQSVEFHGLTCRNLPLSCRLTMSNMAVEIGAKFGICPPDEKVDTFLANRAIDTYQAVLPDPDAVYGSVRDLSVDGLEPQVACHPSVDNVLPVSQLKDVKVDQAYLGSCTNGRLEDLRAATAILKGRRIHSKTRLLVTPASYEVYKAAMAEGILDALIDAGGIINHPACGACFGGHIGLLAPGEVCLSTTNRNFIGRMGSPESRIYLANPYVVAASAVAGRIVHPSEIA